MKDINNIVAQNISSLRKMNKITQLELAEKLNYSDKAVSKWEHGESLPSIEVLCEIASVFGVDMNYLVSDNTESKKPKYVQSKQLKSRHFFITLLAVMLVWFVATILYVCFYIFADLNLWYFYCWSFPVSLLVAFVFNCIWGKESGLYIISSIFVWSLLIAACFQFLDYKIWMILFVGVPIQVGIVLTAMLRYSSKKKYIEKDKAEKTPSNGENI